MDYLKQQIFDAKKLAKSGDLKIDESVENVGRIIYGILSKYETALERINANKSQYTPSGLEVQRAKAAKEIQAELNVIREKADYQAQIFELEKKFDDVTAMEPLQVLINEGREREVRAAMMAVSDSLIFDATFGQAIRKGNPTICGAMANSPLPLEIDPELVQIAIEKHRLNRNPGAASRLATFTIAQDSVDHLFQFADQELGIVADPVAELAGATTESTVTE